jgi:NADPH:quinone reductase-like Zn-dependent oxidoreductase
MEAVLWKKYGGPDALELADVPDPTPGDKEIRVRIHASTVSAGDCEMRSLSFRFPLKVLMRLYSGVFRPKRLRILGQELAGVVDMVGADVTAFAVGDEVFAQTDFTMGGYAEYRCFPAEPKEDQGLIARKPRNLSFKEAAGVPLGGLEALKYLREAAVANGEHVLIVGSAGSIGTFAIQLAKHYGGEVTAVDHGDKLQTMRDCGADHVIDYTREDVTARGGAYDVIFDIVGKAPAKKLLGLLRENGRLILANPRMAQLAGGTRTVAHGKRVITGCANRPDDLSSLVELIEEGVLEPVIDRVYPLDDIREAHRYVETGQKRGSLIVDVARSNDR